MGGAPRLMFHGSAGNTRKVFGFKERTNQLFLCPELETAREWAGKWGEPWEVFGFYVKVLHLADLDESLDLRMVFDWYAADRIDRGEDTTGLEEVFLGSGYGETWEYFDVPSTRQSLLLEGYDGACFSEVCCHTHVVFSGIQLWPARLDGQPLVSGPLTGEDIYETYPAFSTSGFPSQGPRPYAEGFPAGLGPRVAD